MATIAAFLALTLLAFQYDMAQAVGEKRGAQVALIFSRLLPKGYERESFAGKAAHELDAQKIAALTAFVENGGQKLGVPGVSIGIVQDGKVVFAGGFGVRDIATETKADADTLYIIASNTKALTTLMLVVPYDCARDHRLRVRRGQWAGSHVHRAGRAARVRVRRGCPALVVQVNADSAGGAERCRARALPFGQQVAVHPR